MATKYYGINDKWTDDDIENVIEVASEDGSVNSVMVNGVAYGGGGGATSASVTITNNSGDEVTLDFAYMFEDLISGKKVTGPIYIGAGDTETYQIALYDGENNDASDSYTGHVTVTGSITFIGNKITITGDGTITIS